MLCILMKQISHTIFSAEDRFGDVNITSEQIKKLIRFSSKINLNINANVSFMLMRIDEGSLEPQIIRYSILGHRLDAYLSVINKHKEAL